MCETNFGFEDEVVEETEVFGGVSVPDINVIFLLDVSLSMEGERINKLNNAMVPCFQAVSEAAADEGVNAYIRAIKFSSDAELIIGTTEAGVSPEEAIVQFNNLTATGTTRTDLAISLAAKSLHSYYLGKRAYNPVVILVTDGGTNTSAIPDMEANIDVLKRALNSVPGVNEKVLRVALGVGEYRREQLEKFASVVTFEHDETEEQISAPMVFSIDSQEDFEKNFADMLKKITVVSISTSVATSTPNVGGTGVVSQPPVHIDPDEDKDILNMIFGIDGVSA